MSVRLDTNNPGRYQELLDQYDTWMFDCDGVLWHGDRIIDGAVEVLQVLRTQKKRVLFVTNGAAKSRHNYKKKFDGLGIEAHVVRIFSSIGTRYSDQHMHLLFTSPQCSISPWIRRYM
ncbi:Haloacid dehalogenase-like hydrolase-domain-containing protein [Russula brevipes]|nr:Haloacid dehalogenase-like hydrolase-domain-containing protein [Russula brevipes]